MVILPGPPNPRSLFCFNLRQSNRQKQTNKWYLVKHLVPSITLNIATFFLSVIQSSLHSVNDLSVCSLLFQWGFPPDVL